MESQLIPVGIIGNQEYNFFISESMNRNSYLKEETKKLILDMQQAWKNVEITMQHALCTTLGVTNRNLIFGVHPKISSFLSLSGM